MSKVEIKRAVSTTGFSPIDEFKREAKLEIKRLKIESRLDETVKQLALWQKKGFCNIRPLEDLTHGIDAGKSVDWEIQKTHILLKWIQTPTENLTEGWVNQFPSYDIDDIRYPFESRGVIWTRDTILPLVHRVMEMIKARIKNVENQIAICESFESLKHKDEYVTFF